MDQILSSYHNLINFGILKPQIATERVQDCYEEIITGELQACFKVLIKLNLEQAQVQSEYLKNQIEKEEREDKAVPLTRMSVKRSGIRKPKEIEINPKKQA